MKTVLILSAILFVTASSDVGTSSSCKCGLKNRARIINDKEDDTTTPWMVSVMKNEDSKWKHICGGSIITPWHILTAAHCSINASIGVLVGYYDLKKWENTEEINIVERRIVHENYVENTQVRNDIALLVTTTKIEFSLDIGPVCMPNRKLKIKHKHLEVTGWGITEHGKLSNRLLKVTVKALSHRKCQKLINKEGARDIILPSHLCARGNKGDSCKGDSGGPLVWKNHKSHKYTQVALVSYGANSDCAKREVSVNTDVSFFIDWININVAETKPGERTCTEY